MEPKDPDPKPQAERRPYEPPKLRRLGSVRELTLKSGIRSDAPPPHPGRP